MSEKTRQIPCNTDHEFDGSVRKSGVGRLEATMEACRLRLQPIPMTSITFIFGVLHLAISTGVMGGMVGTTALGIFFVPIFFVVVRRLLGDRSNGMGHPARESRQVEPLPELRTDIDPPLNSAAQP